MSQLNFEGGSDESRKDRIWSLVFRMQREGYFSDLEIAREGRKDGTFSEEWWNAQGERAAAREVSKIVNEAGKEGIPGAVKTEGVHQFRLLEWATDEELDFNILEVRKPGIDADIRVARALCNYRIKRYPKTKTDFLRRLPDYLQPEP